MPAKPAVRGPVVLPLTLVAVLLSLLLAVFVAVLLPADAAHARGHRSSWDCLAHYESSGRWHISTGNGHYGGLQFTRSTWRYYGGAHYSHHVFPNRASRHDQIVIGKRVAYRGWLNRAPQGGRHAWPNTWPRCH